MIRVVLAALLIAAPLPALAHKIIVSVYAAGSVIEGEIGFSSGDMARGQLVEVFDDAGDKLGQAVTDDEGFFTFTPTRATAHHFRADLGAGHVAQAVLGLADLPKGLAPVVAAAPGVAPVTADVVAAVAGGVGAEEIARIVRDEMRPLRREIADYKEKTDLQTILGGMGYIAGLFGLGFYLAARRKLKEAGHG